MGSWCKVLCPVVVGRDAELEAIDAALAAALAGHGGCLVITGEAGIAKSRLAGVVSGWLPDVRCRSPRPPPSGR